MHSTEKIYTRGTITNHDVGSKREFSITVPNMSSLVVSATDADRQQQLRDAASQPLPKAEARVRSAALPLDTTGDEVRFSTTEDPSVLINRFHTKRVRTSSEEAFEAEVVKARDEGFEAVIDENDPRRLRFFNIDDVRAEKGLGAKDAKAYDEALTTVRKAIPGTQGCAHPSHPAVPARHQHPHERPRRRLHGRHRHPEAGYPGTLWCAHWCRKTRTPHSRLFGRLFRAIRARRDSALCRLLRSF